MPWPEYTVSDIPLLWRVVSELSGVGPASTTAYVFRGQANADWSLNPSLVRHFDEPADEQKALSLERDCMFVFKEKAHLHVPVMELPHEKDNKGWWALMQHHGAPTRLLDWTTSFLVALYFAVLDQWENDGVVYVLHLEPLGRDATERNDPKIVPWFPTRPSQRMVAQQGLFLFGIEPTIDHERYLDELYDGKQADGKGEVYRRVVVPAELKAPVLKQLRSMNIHALSLFPGVDGLGRSASELARLSGPFPRDYCATTR